MRHVTSVEPAAPRAAALPAIVASPRAGAPAAPTEEVVNDIHSGLSRTRVRDVVEVQTVEEVQRAVRAAKVSGLAVSISGGRHAMGSQAFVTDGVMLDTRGFDDVLDFDAKQGTITVEPGIEWPALIDYLAKAPANSVEGPAGYRWSIRQKQTGADRLSIGGAISANIHGRGLAMKPFVDDLEAVSIVDASGNVRELSRTKEPDLFRHVVGGYGMFGVITSATVRLAPREQLERTVEMVGIDELDAKFDERIRAGHRYGDFQFDIDPASPTFLQRGVFSTYRPVADPKPIPAGQKSLSTEEWGKLMYLAHTDKSAGLDMYAKHYLATDGQKYWSDTSQMANYTDGYHVPLDKALGAKVPSTEMITEVYVPRSRLAEFMKTAAKDLRARDANVIYGTVRLIEQDDVTALAWAREPWASVIFNLHTTHTPQGIEQAKGDFRHLIDIAGDMGGSYYLTYHKWASKDQVSKAYPQMADVLAKKLKYDPDEVFQSDWYRHNRDMFASGTRDAATGAATLTPRS